MTDNLYTEMNRNVIEWFTNPPCCKPNNLYMVLIAHNKAVLFVLQLDTDCVSTYNFLFFVLFRMQHLYFTNLNNN